MRVYNFSLVLAVVTKHHPALKMNVQVPCTLFILVIFINNY